MCAVVLFHLIESIKKYVFPAIYKIYERILIDDRNDVPKNYTIIQKYFGSYYKPVIYYEINVNVSHRNQIKKNPTLRVISKKKSFRFQVESGGYIDQSNEEGVPLPYDLGAQMIQVFNANVHINGAKNVTATLSIYGIGYSALDLGGWFKKQRATKSITYIYVKNASSNVNVKPVPKNSIGHRREGDQLLHFESRNVTNVSRFPSKSFEYSGSESNEYITYVGFSFNVS